VARTSKYTIIDSLILNKVSQNSKFLNIFSIYLHYPFCRARCPYCAFATDTENPDISTEYRDLILREMEMRSRQQPWEDGHVVSVYFGGGTPSMMPPEFLEKVITQICSFWSLQPDAEVTIETNPGTHKTVNFSEFLRAGINRVSIGAQSFHNSELRTLGRIHNVEEICKTVNKVREAGFENISLDLIYGIPGQTVDSVRESAKRVIDLGVEHLSTYSLSIEPETPFEMMANMGHLKLPDQDLVADEYAAICDEMSNAGFDHYELTNFAHPGKSSKHNRIYWRREPYLGFGTGSHSFDGKNRFWNPSETSAYLSAIRENIDPVSESERLSEFQIVEETVYLSLRTDDGLDRDYALEHCDNETISDFTEMGVLKHRGNRLHVSEPHWLLLDEIVARLLQYLPSDST